MVVFACDEQWVADLVDVSSLKKWNKGYRFSLTVVDVLSKYTWAVPLKNKTGKSVTDAFQRILKDSKGRQPLRLQTDVGKESYNQTLQKFLKDKGIAHFSTHGDSKAVVVERWNCTLKESMYRMFAGLNTLTYFDRLPMLVRGYNVTASKHRPGPSPSHTCQQTHRVGSSVRATFATTETANPESGTSGASQQKTSPFSKRCPPTRFKSGTGLPWKRPFTVDSFLKLRDIVLFLLYYCITKCYHINCLLSD